MPDERKADRFALRQDAAGWTVYEVWSSKPAIVAAVAQTGLSEADAQHTAKLLNGQARRGDSSMRARQGRGAG
jgi:hypothetical protein